MEEALGGGDRVKAFDALLDLAYVAYGTALFLGVDSAQWAAGMRAVHNCNMAKIRVAKAEDSQRGSTMGWRASTSRRCCRHCWGIRTSSSIAAG